MVEGDDHEESGLGLGLGLVEAIGGELFMGRKCCIGLQQRRKCRETVTEKRE